MDEADVLAECAADPDDDGPRLVWADLVGGERGELVVVQCDLARGGLPPAEAAARRRRERNLLGRHATAWAGGLARIAKRWRFRRGFVEAAQLRSHDARALAEHPLLSSIAVEDVALVSRFAGLRRLAVPGAAIARVEPSDTLRTLVIDDLDARDLAAARAFIANTRIEQLRVHTHELDAADIEELLDSAPHVDAFEHQARAGELPLAFARRLRALRAGRFDVSMLAGSSSDMLERLHLSFGEGDAKYLLGLGALHTLGLAGDAEAVLRTLAATAPLPRLRVVHVGEHVAPATLRAFIARYGAQLELLGLVPGSQRGGLAIAGEVRTGDLDDELPHHDLGGFLAFGEHASSFVSYAAIARVDVPMFWDLSGEPVEDGHYIGRSTDAAVRLEDGSVARRHARLVWREGRHVIDDLSSANGIYVDGERAQHAPLTDGAELIVGRVVLRYFVGHGAIDRAHAAAERSRTHEPITKLAIDERPPRRVEIANWDRIKRRLSPVLEPLLLRAIAAQLDWYATEPLTWIRHGVFGAQLATAKRIGSRTLSVTVGETTIDAEIVTA